MKYILILLTLLATNASANNDVIIFGGIFAYNNDIELDTNLLSPNGYFGIKVSHAIDNTITISTGIKHESSIPYKEINSGFDGVFFELEFKIN